MDDLSIVVGMTSSLTSAGAIGGAIAVARRAKLGVAQFSVVLLVGLVLAAFLAWMAMYASSWLFQMRWAGQRAPKVLSWRAFMPLMFFTQFILLVSGALLDMWVASCVIDALLRIR